MRRDVHCPTCGRFVAEFGGYYLRVPHRCGTLFIDEAGAVVAIPRGRATLSKSGPEAPGALEEMVTSPPSS